MPASARRWLLGPISVLTSGMARRRLLTISRSIASSPAARTDFPQEREAMAGVSSRGIHHVRVGPAPEVATTRLPGSNRPRARSDLRQGDAGDREQPTGNQLWGHALAKKQYARQQGEHRKQQTEGCDAA